MTNKKWYLSKIIWVNAIALIGVTAQTITGKEILTPEFQVLGLSLINLFLRTITKENIIW